MIVPVPSAFAGSTHPYYTRSKPKAQDPNLFAPDRVDLMNAHLPPFTSEPDLAAFNQLFERRAAATIATATGPTQGIRIEDLLDTPDLGGNADPISVINARSLAAMAYLDYFPGHADHLANIVSQAILAAKPGWCGTFGPGVETIEAVLGGPEGNYDFNQMYLIALIYRHYDDLTSEAREHLINELLQRGHVQRPGHDETFTSGSVPVDWPRAGTIKVPLLGNSLRAIGETENHILLILTARYLGNQLLYQRTLQDVHDNRHNGRNGGPSCTDLVLSLLRNILRDDFSEYNAKNYQTETRWALLNLCSYAYDHEVRLAARMVLDYISAHIAVSSSDLRRMVPFRRRNEGVKSKTMGAPYERFMDVGLLDWQLGADPMTRSFVLQTGNTRAYATVNPEPNPDPNSTHSPIRPWTWALADDGREPMLDVLSDYRLPSSIHDLFVNDLHRRFFQRLHRTPRPEEQGGNRSDEDMEIFAGSPSYLITAGGEPTTWAIDPTVIFGIAPPGNDQQLGVAVTTSFMPTGQSTGEGTQNMARDLIQFGSFSDDPGEVANYGVAPDFACGHRMYRPPWVKGEVVGQFLFVKQGFSEKNRPGFFLAIYEQANGFSLMEAFDTWRNPGVTYDQFKLGVLTRNPNLNLGNNVQGQYTTHNGNRIHFVIWNNGERDDDADMGARVLQIDYGSGDRTDTLRDAGNDSNPFLSGTIMTSPREAVVEINNPSLGTKITLDMSDKWFPKRIDEGGRVEQAGGNNEVWVDFDSTKQDEGNFFRPFRTLDAAYAAVAEGGVIKIKPGRTTEAPRLQGKHARLVAPIGGVHIGVQP